MTSWETRFLATGDQSGCISIWDLEKKEEIGSLRKEKADPVLSLVFARGKNSIPILISCSGKPLDKVIQIPTKVNLCRKHGENSSASCKLKLRFLMRNIAHY